MPIITLPPIDSDEMAEICRRDLTMPRHVAAELGQSAVAAARAGDYQDSSGRPVVWRDAVKLAVASYHDFEGHETHTGIEKMLTSLGYTFVADFPERPNLYAWKE